MSVLSVLQTHWGIIGAFILGIGYVLTHRQAAFAYAKKEAKVLMFIVEANAEKFLLTNGAAKMGYIVDAIYSSVPIYFKPILNKPLITYIVQTLFDKAVAYAEAHPVVKPALNPVPVIEPVTIPNVVASNEVDITSI